LSYAQLKLKFCHNSHNDTLEKVDVQPEKLNCFFWLQSWWSYFCFFGWHFSGERWLFVQSSNSFHSPALDSLARCRCFFGLTLNRYEIMLAGKDAWAEYQNLMMKQSTHQHDRSKYY